MMWASQGLRSLTHEGRPTSAWLWIAASGTGEFGSLASCSQSQGTECPCPGIYPTDKPFQVIFSEWRVGVDTCHSDAIPGILGTDVNVCPIYVEQGLRCRSVNNAH